MSIRQREISMGYRIDCAGNYTPTEVLRGMIAAIQDRSGALQKGVQVTWIIRGNSFDFGYIARTANGGLRAMMRRRIERDMEAL